MNRKYLFAAIIASFLILSGFAQKSNSSNSGTASPQNQFEEFKGLVVDGNRKTPLPYANIYVLRKNIGVISNEKGHFSISIDGLDKTDTICFQYIGYKTRFLPIGQIDTTTLVYLNEEIFNLSETIIFGNVYDPVSIVKNVLKFKDTNYKKTNSKKQIFIRDRNITDINEFRLSYKKSTIDELNRNLLKLMEEKVPKNTTSFTDFLGYVYFTETENDSAKLKVDPIKTVALKEQEIAELKQFETMFENLFNSTGEKEYWKIKSGVFGGKIDDEEEDTIPEKDTLNNNQRELKYFANGINYKLSYSSLDDKDEWEFLHNTGRYQYTLIGGTRVNGEDAYIIDFAPRSSGHFVGRMYISIGTYALIRADYDYAPGKIGKDINLLGVGYTESHFSGSIYFEKTNENYVLKYFSRKKGADISFDRNVSLIKKKKRFLVDETLDEFKVGLETSLTVEESVEYLVLDDQKINEKQFSDFKQAKYQQIIYVDQFDDNLWKGYSIIEPTLQMKDYKKQEVNYFEKE